VNFFRVGCGICNLNLVEVAETRRNNSDNAAAGGGGGSGEVWGGGEVWGSGGGGGKEIVHKTDIFETKWKS
jgi:hypothetical protein